MTNLVTLIVILLSASLLSFAVLVCMVEFKMDETRRAEICNDDGEMDLERWLE